MNSAELAGQLVGLPGELTAILHSYLLPCPFKFDAERTNSQLLLSADHQTVTVPEGVWKYRLYFVALGYASFGCSPLTTFNSSAALSVTATPSAGSASAAAPLAAAAIGVGTRAAVVPSSRCVEWAICVDDVQATLGIARRDVSLGGRETYTYSDEHAWAMSMLGCAKNGHWRHGDSPDTIKEQFLDGEAPQNRRLVVERRGNPCVLRVRCELSAGTVSFAFGPTAEWKVGIRGIDDLEDWYPYVTVTHTDATAMFVPTDYVPPPPPAAQPYAPAFDCQYDGDGDVDSDDGDS